MLSTKNKLAVLKTLVSVALFAGAIGTAPFAYAATTYHFTCSDFVSGSATNASCSGSTITISATSGQNAPLVATPQYVITSGSTYYISYTVLTNTSSNGLTAFTWDASSGRTDKITGSVMSATVGSHTNISFTAANSISGGISLGTNLFNGFTGTINAVCITDTSGGCEAAPPAPPAPTSNVISSSTAAALLVSSAGDIGSFLRGSLPYILGILIALLALGMGFRYVRKYVSGRKF